MKLRPRRSAPRAVDSPCPEPPGHHPGRTLPVVPALAVLLLALAAPPSPAVAAPASKATSADDLVVVDCLLPPKVRRLGRHNTFLAPRKPIKTTALDCRIRGGEYTEPDQANLGTALAVWLPQAQAGDPEAQYYVGQLFERGMGVAPDPAAAAEWYRKAAEQGYTAAQVSLGSLYEAGRGVAADPGEAMRWYRRAAGLAEDLVVLQGSEAEELRGAAARLEAVRAELESKNRELEAAGEEAGDLRRQVEELRDELERLEAEHRAEEQAAAREAARFDLRNIRFGEYHALVIGNGAYRHLSPLPTAVADARTVARTLEERYGFRVRLLEDATRFDVMRALNELRRELTSEDNLLVYYAGHARRDESGTSAFWQPVDAEPSNRANWIPADLVSEHLDLVPARHVLLVADALFSGLRSRSAVARLPQGMTAEERFHQVKLLRDKRCRLVLASGRPAPEPAGPDAEASRFAAAFVKVLRENDGVLGASAVYRDLQGALDGNAPGAPAPEFAAMQWARTDVSEFFFVPRR